MKKFVFMVSLTIASLLVFSHQQYAAGSDDAQELKLLVGEIKIISVNNPKRIVIGNPSIGDVSNVTKSEVTVSAKAAGNTTLVIWDNYGEMSYKIKVFAEDINEVKKRVDDLLEPLSLAGIYSKTDENEGKVVVLGKVKTPQEKDRISSALSFLKDKIMDLVQIKEEEAVVEIDVQVLEIDRDATNTLGFSWPGSLVFSEVGSDGISGTGAKWGKLFKVLNWQRSAFNWTIDALIQEGKARILSRPRLACQSGKEAELLVGGEKPILTTQIAGLTGAGGTTVSYKEFGIKLNIKPTVREDNRIKIVLNMEVSEVGTAVVLGQTNNPTALAYPLTKRNATTELILDDQQTLAIGGLIKRKTEENIRKTPFLGDIPVLGALFRQKQSKVGGGQGERGDTELFITLTPTIVLKKEETPVPKQAKKDEKDSESSYSRYDLPQELEGYAHVIQKRILQNVTYPASAKDAGFQGIVRLSLHLSYKGDLLDVLVKDSSGYKIIDDNAISVVKGISSYPPFPSSVLKRDLWIDIPIEYRLN